MSLTNDAWVKIFDKHNILDAIYQDGFYEIGASDIRVFREPRLMAKFDHKNNLPEIFREHDLAILPISRSKYVLGRFKMYEKVKYDDTLQPIRMNLPRNIVTIDPANLYSESATLHAAYASGMIEDVMGEDAVPTVSGRMSSQEFDFFIKTKKGNKRNISVKNAQIEIDGGYESDSQFMLVEAKKESVSDFLVRQLYFPYRLWQNKLNKPVKPVFFTHSNDIFSFFVFDFKKDDHYNSLQLVEQRDYIIDHEEIELEDILELLAKVPITSEPHIPFPQADSFARVVDLMGLLMEKDLYKREITENYNFDARQTDYYVNAGTYLGLIQRRISSPITMFCLTPKGQAIMRLPYKQKYLSLAACILEHKVFRSVLDKYLMNGYPPGRDEIIRIMKDSNLYNVVQDSTFKRRASTVYRWVEWILSLQNY